MELNEQISRMKSMMGLLTEEEKSFEISTMIFLIFSLSFLAVDETEGPCKRDINFKIPQNFLNSQYMRRNSTIQLIRAHSSYET